MSNKDINPNGGGWLVILLKGRGLCGRFNFSWCRHNGKRPNVGYHLTNSFIY